MLRSVIENLASYFKDESWGQITERRVWKVAYICFGGISHAPFRVNNSRFTCDATKQQNLIVRYKIDGFMQEKRTSIANALELRLSCINPSKWSAAHQREEGLLVF